MRNFESLAVAATLAVAVFGYYRYEHKLEIEEPAKVYQSSIIAHAVGAAPDFAAIQNVQQKKQAFFDYLTPGIALENQRVMNERIRLERIAQHFEDNKLTGEDNRYAKRLGKLYRYELPAQGIEQAWLSEMLHRVNVLPASLVLTQAANESAWGTSRFATQANNYFGQWCYVQGCGLVPLQRSEGAKHEVAKFSSVQESIHRYFMNVNRNKAYYALREIRFVRSENSQTLDDTNAALALTDGLVKYSERGEAYVKDLQAMIRHNDEYWTANEIE